MFGLGAGEIAVIFVIALIFLGPKKLPGLAKGLGSGIREFQNALKGIKTEINNEVQDVKKDLHHQDSSSTTPSQLNNSELTHEKIIQREEASSQDDVKTKQES